MLELADSFWFRGQFYKCNICFQEQPASFRVCCDGSPSAANNVFTLIAVIIFYGFLITPYRRFITVKAIFYQFHSETTSPEWICTETTS
ncbi:hypothetical protein HID58_090086 [Brassica napus]|uniref:Uncharacterized protein n=1 Tax=Brassica napus TaxID=3708 RepID=A0ABQ7XGJ1_BRANA|nr:hypothetical protein HID58_090086 [Brassica napus]